MVKKLLSIKRFDDVIKMQREKHVFKYIWLLERQGIQTSKRDKQYHSSECFFESDKSTEECAGNRIKERTSIFLQDEDSRFHNAAIKLNILLAGSHDIYVADVYYHQSYYLKYAVTKIAGNAESSEYEETLSANILDDFLSKVE